MIKLVFIFFFLLATACSLMNRNNIELSITADKKVNPNIYNKSSPVVIAIYQLSSINNFKNGNLYSIFEDKSIFSKEIKHAREVEVQPGQGIKLDEKILQKTKYLAIIGEFRNPEGVSWIKIIDLDEADIDKIKISINKNKLFIKKHYKREW